MNNYIRDHNLRLELLGDINKENVDDPNSKLTFMTALSLKPTYNVNSEVIEPVIPLVAMENDDPVNTECDSVVIGSNGTTLRTTILTSLRWDQESFSRSVRIILRQFFTKEQLGKHSFSGKSSPAFPNKKPKPPLNTNITKDIIEYSKQAGNNYGVTVTQIKKAITSACADEAKLPKKNRKSINENF